MIPLPKSVGFIIFLGNAGIDFSMSKYQIPMSENQIGSMVWKY